MVEQIRQKLRFLREKQDNQDKKPFIIKIVALFLVSSFLICFMTWNVISHNLQIKHGNSELGEYYFLSTTQGDGIVIQWQIKDFRTQGYVLLWRCEELQNEDDGYCYETWLVSWPPLQISNES